MQYRSIYGISYYCNFSLAVTKSSCEIFGLLCILVSRILLVFSFDAFQGRFVERFLTSQTAALRALLTRGTNLVSSYAMGFDTRRVGRNSQWGGFWGVWGRSSQPPEANGVWGRSPQLPEPGGLGAKPPAAGGTGVWGRSPQRSKILHFFAKIT